MNRSSLNLREKVLISIILFLFLIIPKGSVHAEWAIINVINLPYATPDWTLSDVHSTSSTEGWAVGSSTQTGGLIFHYFNGAWTTVTPPYDQVNFNSVHFVSPNEGWAAGQDLKYQRGFLLRYLNGFWMPTFFPYTSANWFLTGIHFTSSNEGWLVGVDNTVFFDNKGLLFHYLNGSWSHISSPNVSQVWRLSGVHFINPNEGWAVGEDITNQTGVLLHYSNGTWTVAPPPSISTPWRLHDVQMVSLNEGWAVGEGKDGGILLHYQNGPWTVVNPVNDLFVDPSTFQGIHFTSPSEGWIVGKGYLTGGFYTGGLLLHYLNGVWKTYPPPDVNVSWVLNNIYFLSPSEGWAVGYDIPNQRGVLLRFSETLSTPITPNGPISGNPGISYSYSTTGSPSDIGHSVEIQFDWKGDGSDLSPWGSSTQSKTWTAGGTYDVRARARCATDPSVITNWSSSLMVTMTVIEIVSPPNPPIGPTTGMPGVSYPYTTGGSTSNFGHSIEYQFDWKGDGSDLSPWGSSTQSKTWGVAGIYNVRTRARCAIDPTIVSNWSSALTVTLGNPETISTPNVPSGPMNGTIGTLYTYSTGGSTSNLGHPVQCLIDWGDGSHSGWLPVGNTSASKSWASSGNYLIKAQARCATDTSVVSSWSGTLNVNISAAPLADLTGQWISLTQTCRNTLQGTKCYLNGKFTIQNIGNAAASTYTVQFYLSDNNTYDGGDTLLRQVPLGTIVAGGSLTGNIRLNLPPGQTGAGKYVIAVIDADNTIVESNESNNQVVFGPVP
jgi:hypothetical protein